MLQCRPASTPRRSRPGFPTTPRSSASSSLGPTTGTRPTIIASKRAPRLVAAVHVPSPLRGRGHREAFNKFSWVRGLISARETHQQIRQYSFGILEDVHIRIADDGASFSNHL